MRSAGGSCSRSLEDKWFAEARRRCHVIDSGAENTVDHEQALAFVFAPPQSRDIPLPALVEEAQHQEVLRRMRDLEEGKDELVPWEQVRAELLARSARRF